MHNFYFLTKDILIKLISWLENRILFNIFDQRKYSPKVAKANSSSLQFCNKNNSTHFCETLLM